MNNKRMNQIIDNPKNDVVLEKGAMLISDLLTGLMLERKVKDKDTLDIVRKNNNTCLTELTHHIANSKLEEN